MAPSLFGYSSEGNSGFPGRKVDQYKGKTVPKIIGDETAQVIIKTKDVTNFDQFFKPTNPRHADATLIIKPLKSTKAAKLITPAKEIKPSKRIKGSAPTESSRYIYTEASKHQLLTESEEKQLSRTYQAARLQFFARNVDKSEEESDGEHSSDIAITETQEKIAQAFKNKANGVSDLETITVFRALEARDRMVMSNMLLVIKIARNYYNSPLPFLDIVQAGTIGLLKAIDGFEPDLGNKFSTYATTWIRKYISEIVNSDRLVYIPKARGALLKEVSKFIESYQKQNNGRTPGPTTIGQKIALKKEGISAFMVDSLSIASLDFEASGMGEESGTLLQTVQSTNIPGPEAQASVNQIKKAIRKIIDDGSAKLTQKEQLVLMHYYGILGVDERSTTALGEELGCTGTTIRVLLDKGLTKVRKRFEELKITSEVLKAYE